MIMVSLLKPGKMEINVQSIHFRADDKLIGYINKKVSKLDTYFDRIIGADVILKLDNGDAPVKDKIVEIRLKLPRHVLYAEDLSRNYEDSVDASVEHLRKQLIRHKEKINGK